MTRPWRPSKAAVEAAQLTYWGYRLTDKHWLTEYDVDLMRRALRAAYRVDHPTRGRRG